MEKNFKFMGIYIGILCFCAILLILVTSLSNTSLDPSYDDVDGGKKPESAMNSTMEQSVLTLTKTNEELTDKVNSLTDEIKAKDKAIAEYKAQTDENSVKLYSVAKLYISGDEKDARELLKTVDTKGLNSDDLAFYNSLQNKLK